MWKKEWIRSQLEEGREKRQVKNMEIQWSPAGNEGYHFLRADMFNIQSEPIWLPAT